jgi:Tol biopolymer transport system component
MKKLLPLFLCLFVLAILLTVRWSSAAAPAPQSASVRALPSFSDPAISPDHKEIAFISGGDIWTVSAEGGEARLLVSHPATESRPLYSPDGKKLAFVSTRTGNGDIYVLTFASGELKRITFSDSNDQLSAWSRDGRWLYFHNTGGDISGMNDIYRVSVEGGTPMAVSADRYANEFLGAPSPDGTALAFSARGTASSQWWRKGRSHLDEAEIWLRREGNPAMYERVSESGEKDLWPMWTPDGKALYYVSDRSGTENIWMRALGGQARQVTQFRGGRVLWPTISNDGRTIVFERDFGVWKLDTSSGQASQVAITLRGAVPTPTVQHLTLTSDISDLALSPDGKKIAFVAHGEIFAASAKDGGDATRVTHTPDAKEYEIAWSPDSKRIAYVSERDAAAHLYQYDFTANEETQLTRAATDDAFPHFSPDGKLLAFFRGGHEVRVLDLAAKQERVLATASLDRPPFGPDQPFAWSPDSRWIAYLALAGKSFRNTFVVAAAGGESKPVSFLSDVFGNGVTWSPDGTFLLFDTSQRTENGEIARIDLLPREPHFREDQFRDLFKEEPRGGAGPNAQPRGDQAKPAPNPVEITFEGIRRRVSLLPVGVDVNRQNISPDGKWLLMTASAAGQQNLYVYSLDELSREPAVARQLTSTPGFKADAQFTPDSKEVYYLERGAIHAISLDSRVARGINVTAEMDVDFSREKMAMFTEAWTYLRDLFFDANHNGVDWDAVRATYEPHIAGASTPDEVRRVISLMLGELNASHMGITGPGGGGGVAGGGFGNLGLAFDRTEYESSGHLKIADVIPFGPAALTGQVHKGDYLLAVEGESIGAHSNLDELLEHTVGKRIALTIAGSPDGKDKKEVAVKPITTGAQKNLIYRAWVEERRQYVERVSGGRLGYVHMPDMGAASLAGLHNDLDVDNRSKDGVVIDVRNNNGGFVNVYAIDVLARRGYLNMTPRGFPTSPARTELGQRSLELPTILVTNQHSLSDAEDFTEGYRALKLGKVVGEPTAGWIIYTSAVQLIDGSNLRMPFIRITAADGQPMEMHPRPVDIPVVRPIGESYTGHDSQLDAAVKELLSEIGSHKKE